MACKCRDVGLESNNYHNIWEIHRCSLCMMTKLQLARILGMGVDDEVSGLKKKNLIDESWEHLLYRGKMGQNSRKMRKVSGKYKNINGKGNGNGNGKLSSLDSQHFRKIGGLKCLSWNILADVWIEADVDYVNINPKYLDQDYRYEKMLKILAGALPDMIFLQEVQKNVYDRLLDDLGKKYWITPLVEINWGAPAKHKKHIKNGNVSLFHKEIFLKPICSRLKLSENDSGSEFNYANIVKIGRIGGKMGGNRYGDDEKIVVSNIHLESEDSHLRFLQIQKLVKYLERFGGDGGVRGVGGGIKMIIAGDFNSEVHEKLHQYLSEAGFEHFNNIYQNKSKITYFEETFFIDHLYVRNIVQLGKYILNKVDKDNKRESALKLYGSDHFPIFSSIM